MVTRHGTDRVHSNLQRAPQYAVGHYSLGRIYDKERRYELAIHKYNDALRFDPNLAQAHSNIGIAYLNSVSVALLSIVYLYLTGMLHDVIDI